MIKPHPAHWVKRYNSEGWAVTLCGLTADNVESFNYAFVPTAISCDKCVAAYSAEEAMGAFMKKAAESVDAFMAAVNALDPMVQTPKENTGVVHMLVSPWEDVACGVDLDGNTSNVTTKESELTCLKCWVKWFEYVNQDYSESIRNLKRERERDACRLRARAIKIERRDRQIERRDRQIEQLTEKLEEAVSQQICDKNMIAFLREGAPGHQCAHSCTEQPIPQPTPMRRLRVVEKLNTNQFAPTEYTIGDLVHTGKLGLDEPVVRCGEWRSGRSLHSF